GAFGFDQTVYQRANAKISFSQMTMNHLLFRLVFLEQLYRSMTILKGEPYHH
ncbi:MAG: 23S rRNA (pseudouridine(1915)-N(3))-methyltransferase RlmH, partial [Bacteroidia bacterium]